MWINGQERGHMCRSTLLVTSLFVLPLWSVSHSVTEYRDFMSLLWASSAASVTSLPTRFVLSCLALLFTVLGAILYLATVLWFFLSQMGFGSLVFWIVLSECQVLYSLRPNPFLLHIWMWMCISHVPTSLLIHPLGHLVPGTCFWALERMQSYSGLTLVSICFNEGSTWF